MWSYSVAGRSIRYCLGKGWATSSVPGGTGEPSLLGVWNNPVPAHPTSGTNRFQPPPSGAKGCCFKSRLKGLRMLPQHLLPKRLLTSAAGKIGRWRGKWVTTGLIWLFARHYKVNLKESEVSDIRQFKTFNEFFTRRLKPDSRPLDTAAFTMPVDGTISQCGDIRHNQIFQAKGHYYSTEDLLGGEVSAAGAYHNGQFATIYLGPGDYHRVHMPCNGKLTRMRFVPGSIYSVGPRTAANRRGLLARNERVVCEFEGDDGKPFAMVLVGAMIVGSMKVVWDDHVIRQKKGDAGASAWTYPERPVLLRQGEEMGHFLMGSTVVMLFAPGVAIPDAGLQVAQRVRMGQGFGAAAR